jgi:hypothetical protein
MRFAADENFNNDVLRGVRLRLPEVDIVRVQDSEVAAADDPTVLEWAARENRIVLTHDVKTMTKYAYERVGKGLPMPGVVEINAYVGIGQAIEALVIFIECSVEGEWEGQVIFLPL